MCPVGVHRLIHGASPSPPSEPCACLHHFNIKHTTNTGQGKTGSGPRACSLFPPGPVRALSVAMAESAIVRLLLLVHVSHPAPIARPLLQRCQCRVGRGAGTRQITPGQQRALSLKQKCQMIFQISWAGFCCISRLTPLHPPQEAESSILDRPAATTTTTSPSCTSLETSRLLVRKGLPHRHRLRKTVTR